MLLPAVTILATFCCVGRTPLVAALPVGSESGVGLVGPEWTRVEGSGQCFEEYRSEEGGIGLKCLPLAKLDGCSDGTWMELSRAFGVVPQLQFRAGPPAYLSIPGHEDCLGFLDSTSSRQYCLPAERCEDCTSEAWESLLRVFEGQPCPVAGDDEQPTLIGGSTFQPAYLSIPGHRSCLGSKTVGSASFLCKPSIKPAECDQQTFDAVNSVFEGDSCDDHDDSLLGLPPSFAEVEGSNECLKEYELSPENQGFCLPLSPPNECSQEAFDSLMALTFGQQPHAISRAGPPAYLSIPGHQECLDQTQSDTHSERCLPVEKPFGCNPQAWRDLEDLFGSVRCSSQQQ